MAAVIEIGKMYSIDRNIRYCKFNYAMEVIVRNRLYSFNGIRQFPLFRDIDLTPPPEYYRNSRDHIFSKDGTTNSHYKESSHGLMSTEDK